MHFGFPREPFASVFVQIGPILLSKERRAAALRAADEVVAALGPLATRIESPDPRWTR